MLSVLIRLNLCFVFLCAIYSLPAHIVVHINEFVIFTMSAKFLKRYEAVFLVNHAKGPKMTYKAASKYMRKSEAFIKTWVKRYLEVGNVDDLPERKLARVTITKEDKTILRLFQDNPGLSLRCAQIKLRKKNSRLFKYDSKSPACEKKRVFSINFEKTFVVKKARGKTTDVGKEKFRSRLG